MGPPAHLKIYYIAHVDRLPIDYRRRAAIVVRADHRTA